MRNHNTEQLQGGNGKINSEKVSGQSSSIRLVSPYIISPWEREGRVQRARGGPMNRGWGDNWRGTIQITERGRVGAG